MDIVQSVEKLLVSRSQKFAGVETILLGLHIVGSCIGFGNRNLTDDGC